MTVPGKLLSLVGFVALMLGCSSVRSTSIATGATGPAVDAAQVAVGSWSRNSTQSFDAQSRSALQGSPSAAPPLPVVSPVLPVVVSVVASVAALLELPVVVASVAPVEPVELVDSVAPPSSPPPAQPIASVRRSDARL